MKTFSANPISWVPSLYFAEGIPYVIVMSIAVILYKRLGLSNEDITLYTSWLYLPWVIKPFWSPIVEIFGTKRQWIVVMQMFIGAALAGVAFSMNVSDFVQWSLAFFWLMAFSSATHDIAADGFYMLGLTENEQAQYVGIRSTFYRISTIAAQGLLLILAGRLESAMGNIAGAWTVTLGITCGLFVLLCAYHWFVLPRPSADRRQSGESNGCLDFLKTFISFFQKPGILIALAFMLLYRFPEALLVKISPLFLIDTCENGGLGLSTDEVGLVQGTFGVLGLILGGILGGFAISAHGFKKWLWPMVLAISLPNAVYIFLACFLPENIWLIAACIAVEQFGYGFGFTAYMLYLIYFSRGNTKTAHYAFCTGFMALSMMIPGFFSGKIQEYMGYTNFFILVMALVPLTFIVAALIKVDENFGVKK